MFMTYERGKLQLRLENVFSSHFAFVRQPKAVLVSSMGGLIVLGMVLA